MAGNQYPDGCAACPSPPAAPQNRAAPRGTASQTRPVCGRECSEIIPRPRTPGQRAPKSPEGAQPVPGALGREEAELAEGKIAFGAGSAGRIKRSHGCGD